MTTVILNDFVTDSRTAILFNYPQDFQRVNTFWETEDQLLTNLQGNEAFKDRTRWCDLSPTHFRFLIMSNLNKVSALNDDERGDPNNIIMASLTFLLTGFIKCLETRTESTLELMRINRLGDHEVLYDYAGSINMSLESLRPKSGLRVIVDNTGA
jgi:hypothetical protein